VDNGVGENNIFDNIDNTNSCIKAFNLFINPNLRIIHTCIRDFCANDI